MATGELDKYIPADSTKIIVIPGIMSPDELAEHELFIYTHGSHGSEEGLRWRIWQHGEQVATDIPTALDAQWYATCLAKEEINKNVDLKGDKNDSPN